MRYLRFAARILYYSMLLRDGAGHCGLSEAPKSSLTRADCEQGRRAGRLLCPKRFTLFAVTLGSNPEGEGDNTHFSPQGSPYAWPSWRWRASAKPSCRLVRFAKPQPHQGACSSH